MTVGHPASSTRTRGAGAHFLQGLLMGGADVIPGVSGGTVALILGIYERLVMSIRNAATSLLDLARRDLPSARQTARAVEWGLVLPLAGGILLAIAIGSVVVPPLLERFPSQMLGLFFGLIAGSLVVPWRRIDRSAPAPLAVAASTTVIAAVLVGLPPRTLSEPSLLLVFACASVAICAMILPGVSGAFLLLVLGIYEHTLAAISSLDVAYIAVFAAGAVVGLGIFSRLLAYLLARHHGTTMAALVGLMAGSLRALWPWQNDDRGLLAPQGDPAAVALVVGLAAVGFLLVTALIRFGDR